MRVRTVRSFVMLAMAMLASACSPPPSPVANWVTSTIPRTQVGVTTTNTVGAWTSTSWFATLQVVTSTPTPPSATLLLFPRSGPGGATLGTPQSIPITADVGFAGPMGANNLIAMPGPSTIQFFRQAAGTWSAAGSVVIPTDRFVTAVSDRWIVLRSNTPPAPGVDGTVLVYEIDNSGPSVTASPAATLGPDPAWPAALREGFGINMALDGNLLAVTGQAQVPGVEPGGRVFRATNGTWQPVVSVGGVPGGPVSIGQGLAVDDGATVDRVAVQVRATSTSLPTVDVFADSGSGFALEQSLSRTTGPTDVSGGLYFGSTVAMDGTLLATTSRQVQVPSSEVGHADVKVGYVQMYRLAGSWAPEAEVATFTNPAPADVVSTGTLRLMAAGNNVAATQFVSPDPPVGCTFPCFIFGFEAWSIDRTN